MKKDPRSFDTTQLPNGFRIHTKQVDASWTYVALAIGVGHRMDPIGKEGLTHVLEHALSDNGKGLVVKNRELHDHGIRHRGAQTGMERMAFTLQGIEDSSPHMIQELASMFHGRDFVREIEKHRVIVRQEREANPLVPQDQELCKRLYRSHRVASATGLPSAGSLDALTGEDLESHCAAYVVARDMHLLCYGAEASRASEEAAMAFSTFHDAETPILEPVTETLPIQGGVTTFNLQDPQKRRNGWTLRFAMRLPRLTECQLQVIRRTVRTSLVQELREDQQMVYDFRFPDYVAMDHALLYINTRVGHGQMERVVDELKRLLFALRDDPERWERSRQEILLNRQLDDPSGIEIMNGALKDAVLHGRPLGLCDELEELRGMDLDELREICHHAALPGRLCGIVIEH